MRDRHSRPETELGGGYPREQDRLPTVRGAVALAPLGSIKGSGGGRHVGVAGVHGAGSASIRAGFSTVWGWAWNCPAGARQRQGRGNFC